MRKISEKRAHKASAMHSSVSNSDKKTKRIEARHARVQKRRRKPYLFRHVGLLVTALVVTLMSTFQLGVLVGRESIDSDSVSKTPEASSVQTFTTVKSSLGYGFSFDNATFSVSADELTDAKKVQAVSEADFRANKQLISVRVRPKTGLNSTFDATSQLSFQVNSDQQALFRARKAAANTGKSDWQLAAEFYAVTSDSAFKVVPVSSSDDQINGLKVRKTIYQHTPSIGSLKKQVYSVQWAGVIDDRFISLHLEGLVGSSDVPIIYQQVFDTLQFNGATVLGVNIGNAEVLGEATFVDNKYFADAISPSVVKIYKITCGYLTVYGREFGVQCGGGTGSGFFITEDGYIATNGHVINTSPEDIFFQILIKDPALVESYLTYLGVTAEQAQRPDVIASIISDIYEDPKDQITLSSKTETQAVAFGDAQIVLQTQKDLQKFLTNFKETSNIKSAKTIASDFKAQDLLLVELTGLTSSDVAILKVDVTGAPALRLGSLSDVSQNQKISIFGYPGDADNVLTDNSKLTPTVTNGTISAVRDAAGGKYKLIQSDADASGGNSGGPIVTADGNVVGLLTYRFKDSDDKNAAKSYGRDVADLKQLVTGNSVTIAASSKTFDAWIKGMDAYSTNHFSKAIKEFEKVQKAFPGHRLAASYIDNAKKAIAEGRDVKDFPVVLAVIASVSIVLIIIAIFLIVRHHGHHQKFKMTAAGQTPQIPASMPTQTVQAQVQQMPQQFAPAPTAPIAVQPPQASITRSPQPPVGGGHTLIQ